MTAVHICRAKTIYRVTRIVHCPTCERRRKMLYEYAEWYGATETCLTCGEQWGDGERLPRPFAPGWRKDNVAAAKLRAREPIASAEPEKGDGG